MMYDSRNPYGAQGGYVRDGFYGNDMRGYGDSRDYEYEKRDQSRGSYGDMYDQRYNGGHMYGDIRYNAYRDGHTPRELSEDVMRRWARELFNQLEDKEKQTFKMEEIIKRAESMGIRFNKFSPDEFYIAVLMMVTDYSEVLGSSPDVYLKLAKYFLCDEDAGLRYGAKLAAYYYHIVEG